MKVSENGDVVRLVPETETEQKIINRHFPDDYLKTSKVMRVKGFVDQFGNPAKGKYLELKGCGSGSKSSCETPVESQPSELTEVSHTPCETASKDCGTEFAQAVNS